MSENSFCPLSRPRENGRAHAFWGPSLGLFADPLEKSTLAEVGKCKIKMYKFGQIEIASKEFNSVYQIQKDVDLEKIRVSEGFVANKHDTLVPPNPGFFLSHVEAHLPR